MIIQVCKEDLCGVCVPWRVGNCLCLVRCWLGGFVPAVFSEGLIYRPSSFGPALNGSTWTDAAASGAGRGVSAGVAVALVWVGACAALDRDLACARRGSKRMA